MLSRNGEPLLGLSQAQEPLKKENVDRGGACGKFLSSSFLRLYVYKEGCSTARLCTGAVPSQPSLTGRAVPLFPSS